MGKNIVLVLNAILYNRGSEALARGLVQICKQADSTCSITLASNDKGFKKKANLPQVDKYISRIDPNLAIKCLAAGFGRILHMQKLSVQIAYHELLRSVSSADLVIIVGADNYDAHYNGVDSMHELNLAIAKRTGCKKLLYDCSLEKAHMTSAVLEDIGMFDAVTARECITLENFRCVLPPDKLYYFPDPAFLMEPEEVLLPKGFQEGNMVGVNLSGLVLQPAYGGSEELILQSYINMIDYILQNTSMGVALIPHVMNGADICALDKIYANYTNNNRVVYSRNEQLSAPQIKSIIAKCGLFVGARTHATIAAYSSCVPTLVVGYSVKSIGIARDLFETDEHFVLPVYKLQHVDALKMGFSCLYKNRASIKARLEACIPIYKEKAAATAELIQKLL